MKRYLNVALTIFFLVAFAIYFAYNLNDFKILLDIKIYYLFIIALLQFSVILVNAYFFIFILDGFKLKVNFKESLLITILSAIGNYFTPFRGGAGIRAIYLKRKHAFSYSKFLSTLAGNYIIVFLINSLIALLSLSILLGSGKHVGIEAILLFAGIFMSLTIIILFPISTKFLPWKKIALVVNGWNELIKNKPLIIKLIALTLLNAFLGIFLYYIELYAIGVKTNLFYATIFSSISAISLLLSLTPGSLGIRESLLVLFQSSIALETSEILAASVVDRGIYFFVMIILALFIRLINFDVKKVG